MTVNDGFERSVCAGCLPYSLCDSNFATHLAAQSTTLRRWRIHLGALVGLVAGAAKEAGDATGLWESAGASVRDGVADLIGVGSGVLLEVIRSLWRYRAREFPKDGVEEV